MKNLEIVEKYRENIELYEDLAHTMENLIRRLLKREGLQYHSIESRAKTVDSLSKKVEIKDKYDELEDITDLSGVRIITYYSDDVDRIAKLIEREFIVDEDNSIDKRKSKEPDRFGYMSLHYVVSLNNKRVRLEEYDIYKNIKFEIQIRSILQHTWAEIEHDLGYKSEQEVPYDIRRSFSRLAGLLEIADNEFLRIREDIKSYIENLNDSYYNAKIDRNSIDTFLSQSTVIKNLNKFIENEYKINIVSQKIPYDTMIKMLIRYNIFDIYSLENEISNRFDEISDVMKLYIENTEWKTYSIALPIIIYCGIRMLEENENKISKMIKKDKSKYTELIPLINAYKKKKGINKDI